MKIKVSRVPALQIIILLPKACFPSVHGWEGAPAKLPGGPPEKLGHEPAGAEAAGLPGVLAAEPPEETRARPARWDPPAEVSLASGPRAAPRRRARSRVFAPAAPGACGERQRGLCPGRAPRPRLGRRPHGLRACIFRAPSGFSWARRPEPGPRAGEGGGEAGGVRGRGARVAAGGRVSAAGNGPGEAGSPAPNRVLAGEETEDREDISWAQVAEVGVT
ncbi:translation initiation factor IF-2-like [Ursus americanus]|uniref:translation initiation factor IF-2-like n=1 Tax=Ursus americanus TaxID=9643 RepID=UPI001E679654|nr:translation initiation factor IF-2-like [Ursus americanus]